MPVYHLPGSYKQRAYLTGKYYFSQDGASLPLRHWLPESDPKAVLIALHGFNDYSNFFDKPGTYLSTYGVACYAYDQRGFGDAPRRGLWAGTRAYTDDLRSLATLLKKKYPEQPLFLLGESMGAAVVMAAMNLTRMSEVEGIILVAPAIWARETMPWYQTSLLAILAHTLPGLTLTGKSVGVQASDNIEMLRALGHDPLVIKKTRVEAIYGLTDLMDAAFYSAEQLQSNTLLLYGEKDEVIPKKPTYEFLHRFLVNRAGGGNRKTVGFYSKGYHMLLRDLQAEVPWQDILSWINKNSNSLPSGADRRAIEVLSASL